MYVDTYLKMNKKPFKNDKEKQQYINILKKEAIEVY